MTTPEAVASSARIYNYLLGGDDHYRVDQEAGETFKAVVPNVQEAARAGRGFVLRATRFMAEQGIDQFIDIGCGIEIAPNVHDIAREVQPDARVVYVDNDPIVIAKGQAMRDVDGIATIYGDLRDPAAIFADQEVARLLDLTRPIGVVTAAVWHFLTEGDPAQHQAAIRDAMAPGSYFALTHACSLHVAPAQVEAIKALYKNTTNRVQIRSQEEIAALMAGFDLVEPGLVPLHEWRPVEGDPFPQKAFEALAGVGILRST